MIKNINHTVTATKREMNIKDDVSEALKLIDSMMADGWSFTEAIEFVRANYSAELLAECFDKFFDERPSTA